MITYYAHSAMAGYVRIIIMFSGFGSLCLNIEASFNKYLSVVLNCDTAQSKGARVRRMLTQSQRLMTRCQLIIDHAPYGCH